MLGQSLFYMQYFNPGVDYEEQAERISKMCDQYAEEWNQHLEYTQENRMWFLKFMYRFADEVENQC
jgi:hypothetical protein